MQGPGRPLVSKEEKIEKKPVRKINSKTILPIVIVVVLAIVAAVLLMNQNSNTVQDLGVVPVTGGSQTSGTSTGADTSDTNPGTTTGSADDGSVAPPIETDTGTDISETDSTATPTETALGWFEYYDLNGDFNQLEASQIFSKQVHFVVAGDGSSWDVSNHLPITITITHDDSVVWTGTITAEKGDYGWNGLINCRGADGCSMDGPEISEGWTGDLIIEARDLEATLLAKQVFDGNVAVGS